MLEINFDNNRVPNDSDLYVLFAPDRNDLILLEWKEGCARFPRTINFDIFELTYIGLLGSRQVWTAYMADHPAGIAHAELSAEGGVVDVFEEGQLFFVKMRKGLELLGEELYMAACRASMIVYWRKRTRFCGVCGFRLQFHGEELAMVCSDCNEHYYPQISPAVIVAIYRNREILLVRSRKKLSSFYGLVSGYVEAGESLEQAVHREVKEETNLKIENLKYVESQSWPFPNSQMLAFTADYKSGELRVQKSELIDAHWFSADDMPPLPPLLSVSGFLIEEFLQKMK